MSFENRLSNRLTESQKASLTNYWDRISSVGHAIRAERTAMFALTILVIFIVIGLLAPYIAPYDPFASLQGPNGAYKRLQPPSPQHPLGTTYFSRDVLSQLIWGTRISLLVAFVSGFAVMIVGTTVGLVSGYYKGNIDLGLMRVVDILYGIPATPLILVLAIFFGASVWNIIFAMVLVLWRTMARVIRSETLSLAEKPFVKAARATGASDFRIIYLHIAPNLIPLILIETTIIMGYAITTEAGISFLGLSGAETISWGTMLQFTFSTGSIRTAWWWVFPPGLCITLLVMSFFYLSRAIEQVTNPDTGRL